jgi:peptide/nickel transport system permease protein
LALLFCAVVIAWTIAPSAFTSIDPVDDLDSAASLSGPSSAHWFGTDALGRDVFSRVVHGTRVSVIAAVIATSLSLVVGSILGVTAGYIGGWFDSVISRTVDVLVAIPSLLLSMAVVSILGFGVTNVAIAVGVAGIPSFVRITRAETLRIKSFAYIDASRAMGQGNLRIIFAHVLPNAAGAVFVLAALDLGGAVLSISALSVLGFGNVPPTPEWGSMVSEGRVHIAGAWWLTTFPGLAIAGLVLSANRISRQFGARRR